MQVHDQNFYYFCNVAGCDARFSKINGLQNHLLKHNDERSLCPFSEGTYQNQDAREENQKLSPPSSQKSSHKYLKNVHYPFDSFEDLASEHDTNMLPRNSFEEDFRPKPEKRFHPEKGATVCPQLQNTLDHIKGSPEAKSPGEQESSKLRMKHFFQLMNCKFLLEENQRMRAKLGIQIDSFKAVFEDQLLSTIDKALIESSI